jgi:NADH:ubiquinone reductase (H+-translocating)
MSVQRIVVLGGGFAGLWSAIGAARKLDELGKGPDTVEVTLVNRDAFHSIRVRNYESDLSGIRVPLDDVLEPVGIRRLEGEAVGIDPSRRAIRINTANRRQTVAYDRLVFAPGSQLVRPDIPGLAEYSFDVDTYTGAARLYDHLQSLPNRPESADQFTVIVVGAGLTGVETAAEIPGRLRAILDHSGLTRPIRVILADHKPHVGSDMGESARPVIEEALASLGVETRVGIEVVSVGSTGITLRSGEEIRAATVVWCAGMRASPLTRFFPVELDRFGRLPVDKLLRVKGVAGVFAAGDVAATMMDNDHCSVMSCQHGRPMGRFAGHNVVCDLFGLPTLPLHIDWYVTVLDLGPWGAVYTQGWDRHVVSKGEAAKKTKQIINRQRIYPPLTRNRAEILAAAAPVVQSPPENYH